MACCKSQKSNDGDGACIAMTWVTIGFFIGVIVMAMLDVFLIRPNRDANRDAMWRNEAVKANVAEWVENEDGSAGFQWIVHPKSKKEENDE